MASKKIIIIMMRIVCCVKLKFCRNRLCKYLVVKKKQNLLVEKLCGQKVITYKNRIYFEHFICRSSSSSSIVHPSVDRVLSNYVDARSCTGLYTKVLLLQISYTQNINYVYSTLCWNCKKKKKKEFEPEKNKQVER